MKKLVPLAVLGCLGLGAAVHRLARHDAGAPAPSGEEETTARPAPACAFAPGTSMSYDLRITTEGKLDPGATGGGLPADVRIGGPAGATGAAAQGSVGVQKTAHATRVVLDLQSLAGVPGDNVLLARLRDLDRETAAITGELEPPFLLRVDRACTITGFGRLDTTRVPAARTQQALAHELQWTMPRGTSQAGSGSNNLGAFVAEFTRERDGGSSYVTRKILRYTRLWSRAGVRPGSEDGPTSSHRKVSFDGGPWFAALEGVESSKQLSIVEATTHTRAWRTTTPAQAFAGAPTDLHRYIWEDLLPRPIAPDGPRPALAIGEAERERLRKTTLDRAVADFNTMTEGGANMKDTWPPLSRLLEVRPELARPLARKLVSGEIPPGSTAGVYVALSNALVPEARDALLEINRDPSQHMMDRSRAAFALVSRPDVGVELAKDLRRDTRAIASGTTRPQRIYAREAALALGMMGGLKGEAQPEVKQQALAAVSEILGAGQRWYDLRPAFAMIANLGDPAMLPLAERYARSPDPRIRQASTVVTRRMQPADTRGFTLEWLRRETDRDVKRRLYATVQMQTFDAHEPVSDDILAQAVADLKSDPPQQMLTRQSILRTIRDAVAAEPRKLEGLREVLRDQLRFEIRQRSGLADLLGGMLGPGDLELAVRAAQDEERREGQGPPPADLPAVRATATPEDGATTQGAP
jgi:hypothetical protein